MTSFLRSIRVRLTLLYSGVLFVVAALLVAGLYIGLSLSLRDQPLSQGGAIRATGALGRPRCDAQRLPSTLQVGPFIAGA